MVTVIGNRLAHWWWRKLEWRSIGPDGSTLRMIEELPHLPEVHHRELERIVAMLLGEFEDALKGRQAPHRKAGRILKIILFGSFARGDWVSDSKNGYMSDYDLLVIVNHPELTMQEDYWDKALEHLDREFAITKTLHHPAQFIVHDLADVNDQLDRGRPFFIDVIRDGLTIYEVPGVHLVQPRKLNPDEERAEAEEHFRTWFPKIASALHLSREALAINDLNDAAFLLHQAAERAYNCLLLTLTLYSPKSHRLNELRALAESVAPRLSDAWPRATRRDRRAFSRIRRAYVEARYSRHYAIDPDELAWATDRVEALQRIVRELCDARSGKAPESGD